MTVCKCGHDVSEHADYFDSCRAYPGNCDCEKYEPAPAVPETQSVPEDLRKLSMNIVNQLFDLAGTPTRKRQNINDVADLFVGKLLAEAERKGWNDAIEAASQAMEENGEFQALQCIRNLAKGE